MMRPWAVAVLAGIAVGVLWFSAHTRCPVCQDRLREWRARFGV